MNFLIIVLVIYLIGTYAIFNFLYFTCKYKYNFFNIPELPRKDIQKMHDMFLTLNEFTAICILFLLSFVFWIPTFIGIVLLISKHKYKRN